MVLVLVNGVELSQADAKIQLIIPDEEGVVHRRRCNVGDYLYQARYCLRDEPVQREKLGRPHYQRNAVGGEEFSQR
jgi:hypothetical protein